MKKSITFLFRIFFIILLLFLVLGFKTIFAYNDFEYQGFTFSSVSENVLAKVQSFPEFNENNFTSVSLGNWGRSYMVYFIPKNDTLKFYFYPSGNSTAQFRLSSSVSVKHYLLDKNSLEITQDTTQNLSVIYCDSTTVNGITVNPFWGDFTIYKDNSYTEILFKPEDPFKAPSFSNSVDSLKTNSFKNFIISSGDLSPTDRLEFTIRNDDSYYEVPDTIIDGYEEINTFILDNTSPYFKTIENSSKFYYEIPKSDLTFTINDNNKYTLLLFWEKPELLYKELSFTVGILTDEELLLTDVNNTNKNIFQKLGDIFNLLNPFHENFFGRKLVELIIDGLKGLFIPENEYFSNYFDELNNWFSDRLGFLYYPLDVLFDLLNRFLSLSSENLIINIPEIKEPTTDIVLIKNQSFDFNTLFENEILNNLHNLYLIIVDAVICFGLVNLLYEKYEEVIAK